VAAHGAHRGLRRTGLESVGGLCRGANGSNTKLGAARPHIVEERRALQLIALGNRVVLEDMASATQHQRCCASPRRHHKSMSARCVPLPAPHLRMSWSRSRETGQLLGVDLVAVEGEGVVWLDPPRLKARVANQRPGQSV
jgi:hypothetical protein